MNCLVTAKEQNRTIEQLTATELQTVETVAISETKVANNAQGITNKNPNRFIEHPIVKIQNSSSLRLAKESVKENTITTPIFKVFPNPSNGIIYIQTAEKNNTDYNLEIINMYGQQIVTQQLTSESVSVQDFATGIYFVRIVKTNGEVVYTQHLVLQQ
jgi:hypothetical protein